MHDKDKIEDNVQMVLVAYGHAAVSVDDAKKMVDMYGCLSPDLAKEAKKDLDGALGKIAGMYAKYLADKFA